MTAPVNCSKGSNKCPVDTYCPATDATEVPCKPCDSSIIKYQGCNCVANTQTDNCLTCAAGKCSSCIDGFTAKKDGTVCLPCSAGCQKCSSFDTCTLCKPGFFLNPKTNTCAKCTIANCSTCTADGCSACNEKFQLLNGLCVPFCDETTKCAENTEFCDIPSKTCKKCASDCLLCKSEAICGACSGGKIANINGVCESPCAVALKNGQSCRAGRAVACDSTITSQCQCEAAENCGSCSDDMKQCKECLVGFKMVDGSCQQCASGFEVFAGLCLKGKADEQSAAKLSGGAIAGIVIASVAVVGGVAGGIAYYFVRKMKK